jgi:zinc/manganese transport system substrate-binding protein
MERQWSRALIVTLIMVLSSMAGCLDDNNESIDEPLPIDNIEDSNNTTTPIIFGNVMVSTYHVGELVSAVAGEHVNIEYMSQDNAPVHDYEITVEDLIRLQNSDLFFYHGLNLEPWVESTLSSLGDDAPPSFQTHAMSTGQITLDYESLLVSNLCEVMNEGPFEATTLGMMPEDHHDEDHDDHHDHNETGEHDDHNETGEHDDHNETGEHDDHNETGEHDDHEGHEHAAVEKTISNPEACPADTNIHIFHMEEGEHVLEFEWKDDESFNMVALKMLGGHTHDHHDHDGHDDHNETGEHDDHNETGEHEDHDDHNETGEHGDGMCHNTETHANYESTEEDCEAAGHQWMGDDNHSDEICHNTETHMNYNSTEEECEAAGHHWMSHDEHNLPEIHAERVVHTFSFPEKMVCYDISTHTLNMTYTTESDCQAAGLMWTANSGPSNDDHDENNETGDHADHDEERHHETGAVVIHIEAEGDYGFALPKDVELHVLMGESGHEDHDDHDDHGSEAFEWAGVFEFTTEAEHTWSMQKVDGDYADETMRIVLIPTGTPTSEESIHEHESHAEALIESDNCTVVEAYQTLPSPTADGKCFELHVGTGDDSIFYIDTQYLVGYGVVIYTQHVPTEFERDRHYLRDSAGTDIEPIAQEGADAHDHGDHSDEIEDDLDSNSDQAYKYDPHSWLDPLAFGAQVDVVLEKLILTFPNGTSNFTENANSYKAQLQALDNDYNDVFGVGGTCEVGGYDKTIVANHNAYSYMSVRYDIDIITVHGLDPEGEPSPQDIIRVINHIKENDITVLFVEEYTNANAVNSIVQDTNVSIEKLYTMEMAPSDSNDNYISLMNKNLNNLVDGIGC